MITDMETRILLLMMLTTMADDARDWSGEVINTPDNNYIFRIFIAKNLFSSCLCFWSINETPEFPKRSLAPRPAEGVSNRHF